jgi:hypothetical protein
VFIGNEQRSKCETSYVNNFYHFHIIHSTSIAITPANAAFLGVFATLLQNCVISVAMSACNNSRAAEQIFANLILGSFIKICRLIAV